MILFKLKRLKVDFSNLPEFLLIKTLKVKCHYRRANKSRLFNQKLVVRKTTESNEKDSGQSI